MLSHQHKTIFIHVPKTAGQSIETLFLDDLGLKWDQRGSLLLRRSTDGGTSWTELEVLYSSASPGIDFYVGVHDDAGQRTWLFLQESSDKPCSVQY